MSFEDKVDALFAGRRTDHTQKTVGIAKSPTTALSPPRSTATNKKPATTRELHMDEVRVAPKRNAVAAGDKFGRLTVKSVERRGNAAGVRQTYATCSCSCGVSHTTLAHHLTQGRILSCGCLKREMLLERNREARARIEVRKNQIVAHPPDFTEFVEKIASEFGVSASDVIGLSRTHNVVLARRKAISIISWTMGYSTTEVGMIFGMDHTTICKYIHDYERQLESLYGGRST